MHKCVASFQLHLSVEWIFNCLKTAMFVKEICYCFFNYKKYKKQKTKNENQRKNLKK